MAALQVDLYELIHEATQARVLYIGNGDQENFFSLSFQTIPKRSNGIAHILEYCVLCESKKYPFFFMTRWSLHTYMNALTGADFTCYPAATQNERDLYNLLDVYLDAVFYATLRGLSFAQEGHRLDFEADRGISSLSSKEGTDPLQLRFEAPRSTSISYPVDAIDVKNPTSYYAVSWITTHIYNQLDCLALAILDGVLMDTDASPLKKALCRNTSSSIDLEIQQIPYTIILTGVNKENEKRIEMELINALQKIAQDGIPEQLIERAFHQIELDRSEIIGDGTPFELVLYFRAALLAHHHSRSNVGTLPPYTSPKAPRFDESK
ncbi:hypothetical protein ACTFIW_008781 [Dictyostelium discoideum]